MKFERDFLLGLVLVLAAAILPVGAAHADLVHSYDLESDGTDGTGSLDLTVFGTPTFEAACDGNGVHLDGIAQYLRATANPWGSTPSGFTVSEWVAPDSLPASGDNQYLVYSNDESYRVAYIIFLRNNSGTQEVHFRVFDSSQNGHDAIATYTTPTDGTFTQFSMTWDGSDVVGYINGSEVATLNYPSIDANDDGTQFELGGASGAAVLQAGIYDSVLVYDNALSSGDEADLYAAGCSVAPPDDGGGGGGTGGGDMATSSLDQTQQNFFNILWSFLAVVFLTVWILRPRR